MTVEIKKTKITASIMGQMRSSTVIDFKRGELLGWCVYKKTKWGVIYRSDLKELSKFYCFEKVKVDENYFRVNVVFSDGAFQLGEITFPNREEALKYEVLLNKVKTQTFLKGQFYL